MHKPQQFNATTTAGHLCAFYENDDDRLGAVTEYIRQGLANDELCIFVTSKSIKQTQSDFSQFDLDIDKALDSGDLLVFEMLSTYISDGRFIANYMLSNVQTFIQDAKNQGFKGLRTAGEMSWLTQHQESADEAISYEHQVNTLHEPEFNFMGLCLYDTKEIPDSLLQGILSSHPTLYYKGNLKRNPHYATA